KNQISFLHTQSSSPTAHASPFFVPHPPSSTIYRLLFVLHPSYYAIYRRPFITVLYRSSITVTVQPVLLNWVVIESVKSGGKVSSYTALPAIRVFRFTLDV